jgi:hypothetical protein
VSKAMTAGTQVWIVIGLALLMGFPPGVAAQPEIGKHWIDRAKSLGLTHASIVIDYSLTDECDVGPVRIRRSSSKRFFDPGTVSQLVQEAIGPFEVAEATRTSSMTKRKIAWNTSVGHSYLVCRFYADGSLASATLVGSGDGFTKTVQDRSVTIRLSTLGTNEIRFSFRMEN